MRQRIYNSITVFEVQMFSARIIDRLYLAQDTLSSGSESTPLSYLDMFYDCIIMYILGSKSEDLNINSSFLLYLC